MRRTLILAVIWMVPLCISVYAVYVVMDRAWRKGCPGWSETDLQEVARRSGLEFVESATLLGALRYECIQANEMWAAVRMDKDDFEAMLGSLPAPHHFSFDTTGVTPDQFPLMPNSARSSRREAAPIWWQPDSAKNFVGRRWACRTGGYVYLLANLDDEMEAVLHIYWSF